MKKKILLSIVPIVAIGSPILIASSCDNTTEDNYFEKRAKETDEEIEKHYVNEYIQKENYIFDDFEQFKFDKEKHFVFSGNNMYLKSIGQHTLEYSLVIDFKKWYDDFIRHYNIFKKIIDNYASDKRKKYVNNDLSINGYQYFVKEIIFNFNLLNNNNATWAIGVNKIAEYEMYTKILGLPNLNLNISLYGDNLVYMNASSLYGGRYFSKLELTTNFLNENDEQWTNYNFKHFMQLFSIPKPKLSTDMDDLDGKYKNVNSELLIKGARYSDIGANPWYPYWPYSDFYEQFVTQNFSKKYDIHDNVKKYTYNVDTLDHFSSIIEVIKYEYNVKNKVIDTHFKFRAEKNNEDLKVFKWEGETIY